MFRQRQGQGLSAAIAPVRQALVRLLERLADLPGRALQRSLTLVVLTLAVGCWQWRVQPLQQAAAELQQKARQAGQELTRAQAGLRSAQTTRALWTRRQAELSDLPAQAPTPAALVATWQAAANQAGWQIEAWEALPSEPGSSGLRLHLRGTLAQLDQFFAGLHRLPASIRLEQPGLRIGQDGHYHLEAALWVSAPVPREAQALPVFPGVSAKPEKSLVLPPWPGDRQWPEPVLAAPEPGPTKDPQARARSRVASSTDTPVAPATTGPTGRAAAGSRGQHRLKRTPLAQLTLMASVVTGAADRRMAWVRTPAGELDRVQLGDRLGVDGWRVQAIGPGHLRLRQPVGDASRILAFAAPSGPGTGPSAVKP